jgi:hypothetical protein
MIGKLIMIALLSCKVIAHNTFSSFNTNNIRH